MQTILDSLSVIGTHWLLLLGILLVVASGQSLLKYALRKIFENGFSAADYYVFSIAGWLLPASLISLLWYMGGANPSSRFWVFILLLVTIISALAVFTQARTIKTSPSNGVILFLILLMALFIILRLAFVSRAVLPLYFDSAQHYHWIRDLLANTGAPGTASSWPLTNYYHLGFHFLTAFIAYITRAEITDVMLVLGQVILALMPFPIFFIVRHETQSNSAAAFALILAAFGWYMPAHAVDWGKYPALASIALIPFILSLIYLSIQNKNLLSRGKYWSLNAIILLGMLVSVFLHSRALIIFAIAALTWILASAWQRLSRVPRFLVLSVMIAALVSGIDFIQTEGILGPLFDPYGNKGLVITLAVLFLSIFAYTAYPRLVFSGIVSTLFFLASLFIPLANLIPGYDITTLLDRPFVEMILYFPLALLGGFGLAALEQMLRVGNARFLSARSVSVFFITLVMVHALFSYDLYPSDCCDIAGTDDLAAIEWMDKNLPGDARILTSSTELRVLPTDDYQGSAGGDAGTWINPMIKRTTVTLPFTTDFSQQQTLDTLCELQVDYVYVGGTGWAFNDSGMPAQPNGYKILLALPGARIYEVTGCQ